MSDPANRRSLPRSLIILACHLTAAIATTIANHLDPPPQPLLKWGPTDDEA